MLFSFEFPFFDSRLFIEAETYMLEHAKERYRELKSPNGEEFCRSFGLIKESSAVSKSNLPINEKKYIHGKHAVRFIEFNDKSVRTKLKDGHMFIPKCIFRRAFVDGPNCRIDIGIKNTVHCKYTYEDIEKIIKCLANMHVSTSSQDEKDEALQNYRRIFNKNEKITDIRKIDYNKLKKYKFINLGKRIARLYLYSTTQIINKELQQVQDKWIDFGGPLLIIQSHDYIEKSKVKFSEIDIPEIKRLGVELYYKNISVNPGMNVKVWVIHKMGIAKDKLNNLKIYLLRLHEQLECLKCLLIAVDRKIIDASDKEVKKTLLYYLNKKYEFINRKYYYGLPNQEVIQSIEELYESEIKDLKEKVENLIEELRGEDEVMSQDNKVKVFFSYSHKDEEMRDELEKHLFTLKNKGIIDTWHDRKLSAGTVLNQEIDKNLKEANMILLLVSVDFLNSVYCYEKEMKEALKMHKQGKAVVIPIILRTCTWQDADFGDLLALPTDGKSVSQWAQKDEAFYDIAMGIKKVALKIKNGI